MDGEEGDQNYDQYDFGDDDMEREPNDDDAAESQAARREHD